jgi:hypothetical protein
MEVPMRRRQAISAAKHGLLAVAVMWLGLFCPAAHAQWIDAGGQANLMHQQELLRNQTTGDGSDWIADDTKREKVDQELRKMGEQRKLQLQPEYARRLRADGKVKADAWLMRTSDELARRDRDALRAKYEH